jgi:high-affinity K+ transport system ATPase subunit B
VLLIRRNKLTKVIVYELYLVDDITLADGGVAIRAYVESQGGELPIEVRDAAERIAKQGATPLLVAENDRVLGVIELKDIVKGGIRERFVELRKMGIKTIMITGDNPLTAAAIAAEAGVDDFLAQATPEAKLKLIREHQAGGRLVAMTGDGTNDAPALAQADVAVAMNTGTQAAKEAGNMVDLDSNPTKLIEVVNIGKQLLMRAADKSGASRCTRSADNPCCVSSRSTIRRMTSLRKMSRSFLPLAGAPR